MARSGMFERALLLRACADSFAKMDPRVLVRNPVMFVVEIGMVVTLALTVDPRLFGSSVHPGGVGNARLYDLVVTLILLITILFGNFAEALAEGRGKAQAEALRRTKTELMAVVQRGDEYQEIPASALRKGDVVKVVAGELIPADGDVIEGVGSVDESAITGESAPVIRGAGGDFSSVTGGTKLLSDELIIRVSANPGETFLDRMISLVEGASRQKTPNEIALSVLLAGLTLIFLIVIDCLPPIARALGAHMDVATLVALLVCLIPTTIGALLSAIGIAGMDRVIRFNVIAKSGKAVEAAGDVNTLILDKTGTITIGNRMAAAFLPVQGQTNHTLAESAALCSLFDETPEGRSVVELAQSVGVTFRREEYSNTRNVEFSADTRMSGLDLTNGTRLRKGAADAVKRYVIEQGGDIPRDLDEIVERVAKEGGTPLVVVQNTEIQGVIYLKDIVKPGIRERFKELREMGIRTVMCTGDNPLTAATIAREAGVDEFVAEAKPEDKMRLIRREQEQGRLVAMSGDGTNDAPALAQADVGLAMQSGTQAAKEAANMVDLDSDPTKLIEIVSIGKQLLITRGAITTFSIANDVAKYFAIIPAMFTSFIPALGVLNVMHLSSPKSAILSALIFNAIIIPLLIPLAMRGVKYRPTSAMSLLMRNLVLYGLGGVLAPFVGIKIIDMILSVCGMA
ncbi:K+-transporting ATPase, B subunit [Alicyclobacillus hesperidum URH17-3-68]|uniref:Potassium-transporting ATPase ATP-binding subunit n=1 Tax=Alicyclobacillus hesperidum TaxID=89784 RepID=A0A1H2Y582_9BACL|nr:potassium-transporting ATPase subunit KdpB [Alicyclobacillus hesperidum]EJY56815.1 K+-transporting ATPase, B subunit [Alicyclobacillus hesperidum URH17-3-68]GLV14926.1 potassium-transporting ATPase ATP-binding subunit [Alicyclobacillus hesperidum]SDW99824.1 K+-transporting ATPase ATPase B chain [Alicyclobacillus hesperidum]